MTEATKVLRLPRCRRGVIEVLEPEMSDEEREGLRNSADALNKALERVRKQPRTKVAASN